MDEQEVFEDLQRERERLQRILQDIRVLTRDLEDYRELRRYQDLIVKFESQLEHLDDINIKD